MLHTGASGTIFLLERSWLDSLRRALVWKQFKYNGSLEARLDARLWNSTLPETTYWPCLSRFTLLDGLYCEMHGCLRAVSPRSGGFQEANPLALREDLRRNQENPSSSG